MVTFDIVVAGSASRTPERAPQRHPLDQLHHLLWQLPTAPVRPIHPAQAVKTVRLVRRQPPGRGPPWHPCPPGSLRQRDPIVQMRIQHGQPTVQPRHQHNPALDSISRRHHPDPSVTRALIAQVLSQPRRVPVPKSVLAPLTERERQVMALVGTGLSNDEIARHLFLSPLTAKTHVSRAMIKLGARDRAQLVVLAYETGLVVPKR